MKKYRIHLTRQYTTIESAFIHVSLDDNEDPKNIVDLIDNEKSDCLQQLTHKDKWVSCYFDRIDEDEIKYDGNVEYDDLPDYVNIDFISKKAGNK